MERRRRSSRSWPRRSACRSACCISGTSRPAAPPAGRATRARPAGARTGAAERAADRCRAYRADKRRAGRRLGGRAMTRLARSICGAALRATALACALSLAARVARAAVYPGARAPAVAIEQRLGAQLPLGRALRRCERPRGATRRLFPEQRDARRRARRARPRLLPLPAPVRDGHGRRARRRSRKRRGAHATTACSASASTPPRRPPMRKRGGASICRCREAATGGTSCPDDRPGRPVRALERDRPGSDARRRSFSTRWSATRARSRRWRGRPASSSQRRERSDRERASRPGDADTAHRTAFAHAAGFVVVTPDGRVSRYFLGVRHDPVALRGALDAASRPLDRRVRRRARPALRPSRSDARPLHRRDVMLGLRIVGLSLACCCSGSGSGATDARPAPRSAAMNATPDAPLLAGLSTCSAQGASSAAGRSDLLFLALLGLCGTVALVLTGCIVWFCVRYRAGLAGRSGPATEQRAGRSRSPGP